MDKLVIFFGRNVDSLHRLGLILSRLLHSKRASEFDWIIASSYYSRRFGKSDPPVNYRNDRLLPAMPSSVGNPPKDRGLATRLHLTLHL